MHYVSDANKELSLQMYANPSLLQDKILSLFEEHVFDGRQVLDGNNVFSFLLEMDATMMASIVNEMSKSFESLYPDRAQTMLDLYRHMGDYDFVGMFATPSMTKIGLLLDRNWLIDNSVNLPNDDFTSLIRIPAYSTFNIGEHTFGIYYPINIEIRRKMTESGVVDYSNTLIHCQWDDSIKNPLFKLTSNVIEHRITQGKNVTYLCLEIPVYQFNNRIVKEDAVSSTGFIKRYPYSDAFYAARVFHWSNNTWNELPITLSDVVYNPDKPTAKIKVMQDIAQVEVSIPQVYFSSAMIGNRIMMMLYTTKGDITIDLRGLSSDQYSASFLVNDEILDPTYSQMLKRIPTVLVVPLSQNISGGRNAYGVTAAKNRIINSAGSDDVLVTNEQVAQYLKELGFDTTKYIDNITDRIFVAKREIVNQKRVTVASALYKAILSEEIFENLEEYDCLNSIDSDNAIMLLPNAVFKYDESTDSMRLLSIKDKKELNNLPLDQRLDRLNTGNYMVTPFHVKISTKDSLPVATAYNLFAPMIQDISFIQDNTNTSTQISIYGINIEHLDSGIGGYKITIALYKTADLTNVVPAVATPKLNRNLTAILKTTTNSGIACYIEGKYEGRNAAGYDLLSFKIDTKYDIDDNEFLGSTSMTFVSSSSTLDPSFIRIPMDGKWDVLFFVKSDYIPEKEARSYRMTGVPKSILDQDMVFVAQQSMRIRFGEFLPALRNNIYTTIKGNKYKSYDYTEFAIYARSIYKHFYRDGDDGDDFIEYEIPAGYAVPEGLGYTIRIDRETDKHYLQVHYRDGDLIYNPITMELYEEHAPGDLILSASDDNPSIVEPEDPDGETIEEQRKDKKTPAVSIITKPEDSDENVEILYESLDTPSPVPSIGVEFVPFYVNARGEEVFTGKSRIQACDYLKTIIDEIGTDIYAKPSDIRRSFVKVDDKYRFQGIEAAFVYVDDVIDDTDIRPKYKIVTEALSTDTDDNGKELLIKYNYKLIEFDKNSAIEDLIRDHNSERLSSGYIRRNEETVHTYGCVYVLDSSILEYDYHKDITEADLFSFYSDYDRLGAYDSTMLSQYDITAVVAEKLLKLRFPWKKLCYAGNLWCVDGYYQKRTLLNFNNNLYIGTNTGLAALTYLQDLITDVYNIKRIAECADAIAYANDSANEGKYVWCSNYDVSEDNSYSNYNKDTEGNFSPLINIGNLKNGALLLGDPDSHGKHFVVVTGDNLEDCINTIKSFNTRSGSCYIRYVYSQTPETISDLDESSENHLEVVKKYFAVINDDINLNNNSDFDCTNWPWELSDWISSDGSTGYLDYVTMELDKDHSYAQIVHERGDMLVDETGQPVIETDSDSRKLNYTIELIMYDYKPIATTTNTREDYVSWVRDLVAGYCGTVITARARMLERTRVYYAPVRTFGLGDFKAPNGEIFQHNLEISLGFKLHVPISVIRDASAKEIIRNNVLSIIRAHLNTGTINCSEVANEIKETLSDNVFHVDTFGIDGDPSLQTLISVNPAISKPYLKTVLSIDSNNDIIETESLKLEYSTLV